MTTPIAVRDSVEDFGRIDLERLHLAASAILALAEDPGVINNALETELRLFRDRIERAMLLPTDGGTRGDSAPGEDCPPVG